MTKLLQKILTEPLLHFLLLGTLVYLYYGSVTSKTVAKSQVVQIVLDKEAQAQLKEQYIKKFHHEPTQKEYTALKQALIYKKVLLQEAYNLGLQEDDALIQARLLKQMEFLLQGEQRVKEPSEALLLAYYKKHLIDYSRLESVSFLRKNSEGKTQQYKELTLAQIKQQFGSYFALKLQRVACKQWSKPLQTKDGIYSLYITDKQVGTAYDFSVVEDSVYKHYKQAKAEENHNNAYKKIAQRYEIIVE